MEIHSAQKIVRPNVRRFRMDIVVVGLKRFAKSVLLPFTFLCVKFIYAWGGMH